MPDPDRAIPVDSPLPPPTLRHVPGKTPEVPRPEVTRSGASSGSRQSEAPAPPASEQQARPKSSMLGSFFVALIVLSAYAAVLFGFRFIVPNRPPAVVEASAGLAIAVVVFFVHALLAGGMAERMHRAEEVFRDLLSFVALVSPSFVRWILMACLTGMFVVAYYDLEGWDESSIARLRVLGACAMPAILATCAAMLVERRFARGDFQLKLGFPAGCSAREKLELKEKVERMWGYENELMRESVQRMARHATILGFLAAAILTACSVILLRYARNENELRHLVALSVGAACTVSFTLNLGQILFRSASNDSTARMMAWAARTLLVVSVATVFLGIALLTGPEEAKEASKGYLMQGYKGALIVGVAVALLGERALRTVTDRAASMLGVTNSGPMHGSDLGLIDGLNDEDLARLAEERIDSTHALAFTPTARLFFNTTYSLARICDWQDQALLIAKVGRTNAQMLREQYMVRGAIAAQKLAREIVGPSRSAAAALRPPESTADGKVSMPGEANENEADKLRALAKALGFTGINQAVLGMRALVDDEVIERLEVFCRSVPVWKNSKNDMTTHDEPPRSGYDI